MRKMLTVVAAAVALTAATAALGYAGTEMCFSKGEKIDGMNKICYYLCPFGEAAFTIKSYQLCPLSIKR